jgi:peptidoglycan/xylan/chitin deacetylase (PgdA/CDA1 family)
LKNKIRVFILHLLKYAGIFNAWRYRHRNDVGILMLHGTADPKRPSRWTPLRPQFSPEYIDWCMGEIGKYYRFISLEDAIDILTGKKPSMEYGITITMDDGYRSNLVDALPVLKKQDAPITIFLPVMNIEKRIPMWFDRLDYVLQSSDLEGNSFRIGDTIFRFSADGRGELAASYSEFRELIKKAYTDEEAFYMKMEEVITYFERHSGKSLRDISEDDPWSGLLRWEEINGCQGEDVQFGSHTMDHYRVSDLQEDALRYQLFESKKIIEKKTGNPCKYIAYPNGDCSESARNIALEAGYEAGVTTEEGINEIGCDSMTLKRISLPWTSDATELLAYVSGLSNSLFYRCWMDQWNKFRKN